MVGPVKKIMIAAVAILFLLTGLARGQDQPARNPSFQADQPAQTDILDIKPPRAWPAGPFPWTMVLVLAAFLLLLLAVLYFLKKKRKNRILPPTPPHETARLALDRLEAEKLPARSFYFRLSEIWRGYLEARFKLGALEMTTEELVPAIDGLDLDGTMQSSLKLLARESDPVKYAGLVVREEKMKQDLSLVRLFVSQTAAHEDNA